MNLSVGDPPHASVDNHPKVIVEGSLKRTAELKRKASKWGERTYCCDKETGQACATKEKGESCADGCSPQGIPC